MNYDLISLGEPLLRLSPPGRGQIRRASALELHVVGSQLNVSANLARLGKSTAFLTKVPDNPLGLLVLDACRSYGLDVSHIRLIPGAKMGVTYVEFSASPRAPKAIYDRAGSAASTLSPEDFDWDALASQARFAYTDGILPGLGPHCLEAADAFLTAARRHGCTTCFDFNYREHLWEPEAARNAWAQLLPNVDVLVTNRSVSEQVFGCVGSDEEVMRRFAADFGTSVVALTHREILSGRHGAWSSQALADGKVLQGRRHEFDIVDRYGTGDAWLAGFLYGYMEQGVAYGLDFGNALCALAHTIEGDIAHLTPEDVTAIMSDTVDLRVRR